MGSMPLASARNAIVYDGNKWHVRRIRIVEFDLTLNEKVYHCDRPIANDLESLDDAVSIAKRELAQ